MLPNLIHPIPVFLRKAAPSLTLQDDNLHEPIGQVLRDQAPTRLLAQISWGFDRKQEQEDAGATSSSDGYVLFRTRDLRAANWTLELGDQICQIGEGAAAQKDLGLYVVGLKWMGHYPDQHGASLVRAYFEDRRPSRKG